jgi:glycine dehydrogenase
VEIIDVLAKFKNMVKKPHHFFEYTEKHFENNLQRELNFMRQQIFNEIHSESKMLRYLRFLEEKDISLNRSMIPLGSCTMKLNSTSEMIPLTWPELNIHPFAPTNQTLGYQMMINCLTNWLKSITKLDGVSFQPKSGATG